MVFAKKVVVLSIYKKSSKKVRDFRLTLEVGKPAYVYSSKPSATIKQTAPGKLSTSTNFPVPTTTTSPTIT